MDHLKTSLNLEGQPGELSVSSIVERQQIDATVNLYKDQEPSESVLAQWYEGRPGDYIKSVWEELEQQRPDHQPLKQVETGSNVGKVGEKISQETRPEAKGSASSLEKEGTGNFDTLRTEIYSYRSHIPERSDITHEKLVGALKNIDREISFQRGRDFLETIRPVRREDTKSAFDQRYKYNTKPADERLLEQFPEVKHLWEINKLPGDLKDYVLVDVWPQNQKSGRTLENNPPYKNFVNVNEGVIITCRNFRNDDERWGSAQGSFMLDHRLMWLYLCAVLARFFPYLVPFLLAAAPTCPLFL